MQIKHNEYKALKMSYKEGHVFNFCVGNQG